MNLLFERFPELGKKTGWISLGEFPTPVHTLTGICAYLGRNHLYVKRDDVSGASHGGNKVRKLEFLLADAQKVGAARIITAGGVGSNHAAATAFYAKRLGLKTVLVLFAQPNSSAVRQNLLMNLFNGAEMVHCEFYQDFLDRLNEILLHYDRIDGAPPYFIPLGGSSPLGVVGYVNAGLECASQVEKGVIPAPDHIYLPLGTMGTAAGLVLGMKVAGLSAKVHAVRVVPHHVANEEVFFSLLKRTNELLHALDESFPLCEIGNDDIIIHEEYFGGTYGYFTEEAVAAARLFRQHDSIHLDGTYSAKAAAAFLHHAEKCEKENLLFWNTKNSRPIPEHVLSENFRKLPESFHRYFLEPVQPLDQEFLT